jgi:phosphoglycolate phosphatase
MRFEHILFDLDGTLTDSGPGIINSVIYALERFNIKVADRNTLRSFIGPPLTDSFQRFLCSSREEAERAVVYFREYYTDKGMFENTVYNGVPQLLATLLEHGMHPILTTSKAEVFAKQILEHFDLARYFELIAGSCLDGTRVKKAEVIRYALESFEVTDLSKVIIVGDREHDVLGAKATGISSLGVLYGYGDREELEHAGADFIAETVADIGRILLGNL